ncbi:MAG: FtsX-like permease family protein [candidate division Zixibacteria bacterium]|nr:FtsX-like permease family protein [candidate division Zixibacteria bacterium]
MNFGEFLGVSVSSLMANKVRSFLTMLGIIIGVAAVITMISLGQGAKKAVADRIEALGTNLIYIRSGAPRMHGRVRSAAGAIQKLDEKDMKRLRAECTAVDHVIPEIRGSRQVIYGNKNWNTTIIGTSPEYLELRNYILEEGTNFTNQDINALKRVAVIGPTLAENLFGNIYPVGKIIRIGRLRFEVIGVTESKGVSGGWMDFDDIILVPYSTAQKRIFGIDNLNRFIARLKDESMLQSAYIEIEKILRKTHRLRPEKENDFYIQSQSDYSSARQETTETMTYLLAGVALVSLLVGGIGIMNIMLVSVTERTREIGVRMAVGARRLDIMMQFILESISLSLLGGIIGILLGVGGSYVLTEFFGWSTFVPPEAVALSFGFAFVVGIFFGIYPARKASRLDPIEALRYE